MGNDPYEQGQDGVDEPAGADQPDPGDPSSCPHDERTCLGALEDLVTEGTDRLVPEYRIMAWPLRLRGSFDGIAWGYMALVERLMTDLYDIQEAVTRGQEMDQDALTQAHIKVHAAVLEMRNARHLLPRIGHSPLPPALAQIGRYCATVTQMYEELSTLCAECGAPMQPLGMRVTVRRT
jgi:hypothetical protein